MCSPEPGACHRRARPVRQASRGVTLIELLTVVAIIVAGILFVTGESGVQVLRRFVARVGGVHHLGLLDVAAQTIRGVAAGIIFNRRDICTV